MAPEYPIKGELWRIKFKSFHVRRVEASDVLFADLSS